MRGSLSWKGTDWTIRGCIERMEINVATGVEGDGYSSVSNLSSLSSAQFFGNMRGLYRPFTHTEIRLAGELGSSELPSLSESVEEMVLELSVSLTIDMGSLPATE